MLKTDAAAMPILNDAQHRVAAGNIEAVADMAALADEITIAMYDAIEGLRSIGYSWADVALRLGITRQAAQQRWGSTSSREPGPDA